MLLLGAVAIAACIAAYFPGLGGPFLFDDFGTLAELADLGGVRDWATLKAFVLGGDAGPTGRPVSLLSFLLDGTDWPTDPGPFKRTNLFIHILTAVFLAALNHRLLRALGVAERNAKTVALLSAIAWMLHPFLVSTTLYVVQRMAQLSTLFVLAALLAYVHGRLMVHERPSKGYAIMGAGLIVFGSLSVLSKENGALLPILVGVLEFTIFCDRARHGSLNRAWLSAFVFAPSAVLTLYLASFAVGEQWNTPNPMRGISVYERLLTESRILIDYLYHWFVPRLHTSGVFQDHYVASSGFFTPITTALSVIAHAAIVLFAVAWRRRLTLVALAILFFYASHLMESTVVNLELYFEHRNYLASVFLFLPALAFLHSTLNRASFATVTLVALAILAGFTRYSASVWSSYPSIVQAAAAVAPTSARAQQQYSQLLFNSGDFARASEVVEAAIARRPNDESLQLHNMIMRCAEKVDQPMHLSGLVAVARTKPFDVRLFEHYQTLVKLADEGCGSTKLEDIEQLLKEMQETPINSDPTFVGYHQLKFLLGLTTVRRGDANSGARFFRQSLSSRPAVGRAMLLAAVMASNENYYYAKVFSDVALSMSRSGYPFGTATEADIRSFQQELRRQTTLRGR